MSRPSNFYSCLGRMSAAESPQYLIALRRFNVRRLLPAVKYAQGMRNHDESIAGG
jgi:hypothetical protein